MHPKPGKNLFRSERRARPTLKKAPLTLHKTIATVCHNTLHNHASMAARSCSPIVFCSPALSSEVLWHMFTYITTQAWPPALPLSSVLRPSPLRSVAHVYRGLCCWTVPPQAFIPVMSLGFLTLTLSCDRQPLEMYCLAVQPSPAAHWPRSGVDRSQNRAILGPSQV